MKTRINYLYKNFAGRIASMLLIAIVVYATSCAPARYVRPLQKGQKAISGTFGGPVIGFAGLTIPMPLTSFGFGYGLKENLTLQSSLHTTSLLFGVIHLDAGATYGILKPDGWKPGLSVTPALNFTVDTWEGQAKLWPLLDVNAYWEYSKNKEHYAYVGVQNWFELSSSKAHGEKVSDHWLPNIQLGHVLSKEKLDFTVEMKYLAPNVQSQELIVDYKSVGQTGAIGIYIGIVRKF